MKELIYEPLRKWLYEFQPRWNIIFENQTMKIITKNTHVENKTLQKMQKLGFNISEISYSEESGIVFSVVEENL